MGFRVYFCVKRGAGCSNQVVRSADATKGDCHVVLAAGCYGRVAGGPVGQGGGAREGAPARRRGHRARPRHLGDRHAEHPRALHDAPPRAPQPRVQGAHRGDAPRGC